MSERTMFKRFGAVGSLWVVCSTLAWGQHLSYGVVVGTALTDDFKTSFSGNAGSGFPQLQTPAGKSAFVGGPMWEWHFSEHVSLEADGLYREMHYNNEDPPGPRDAVVTWEFLVLAKYRFSSYRFGGASVRPFLEAGGSFRAAGNLNQANPSHQGATAGAGFEFPVRKFMIVPTLRYTRWAADTNGVRSRPDQLELLVGFSRFAKADAPDVTRISLGAMLGLNSLTESNRVTANTIFTGNLRDGTPVFGYATYSSRPGPRAAVPTNFHQDLKSCAMCEPTCSLVKYSPRANSSSPSFNAAINRVSSSR